MVTSSGVGRRRGEVCGLHSDWLTYLAVQIRWQQFEKSFVMPAICATSTSHSVQSVGRVHVQRHNEVADRVWAPDLLARLHSRPLNFISEELLVGCPITREDAIVTVAVIAAPAPTTKAAEFRHQLGVVATKMARRRI